ncbi:cilia- and flagella-associated protein 91-like isoform X1 [Anguilla anguilla]|uniref:cilia- and flagella-associated protein 91-like isoform X1 n=1 Tax=Anguilla anguilla TaxID=7936 RepID=UPI0015B2562A|nr:cilia- and flagella-associated protein 91-like isoform X1 [Anguilla anguilla]
MDSTGASQGDREGSPQQASVSARRSSVDSGYSTVVPQAESQHVGVEDIVWDRSSGAEGSADDESQPVCADEPGPHQAEPGAPGPTEGGTGSRAECEGGPEEGARGAEAQTGGDGQELCSEPDGHREFQTPGGGQMEAVCGETAAEAEITRAENDNDARQSILRRRNSNEYHRPRLTEENPLHNRKTI